MTAELLIIANPVSGRRRGLADAEAVLRLLRAGGQAARLVVTEEKGHARRLAADAVAAGVGVVAVCGGDGTLQEVATALAGAETALGIIPCGRCNDLARALGFPAHAPAAQVAETLLSGVTRRIDLGGVEPLTSAPSSGAAPSPSLTSATGDSTPAEPPAVSKAEPPFTNPRFFCTVATLGFDSDVNRFVEQHRLPFRGTPAYLYGVLRVLASFQCPRVRLRGDFGEYDGRVLLAATGNSPFYGGALHIAPGAQLDDGLFHVCIVKAVPRRTVLWILPRVFRGRHVTHPAVQIVRTRRLEIETPEGPRWICADGESLAQTPAVLVNHARVLKVKVRAQA